MFATLRSTVERLGSRIVDVISTLFLAFLLLLLLIGCLSPRDQLLLQLGRACTDVYVDGQQDITRLHCPKQPADTE